jgi:hypothetical protein
MTGNSEVSRDHIERSAHAQMGEEIEVLFSCKAHANVFSTTEDRFYRAARDSR